MRRVIVALCFFVFVLGFTGCSKDENPTQPTPTPQSGNYVGTVAGASESGSISLDINLSKSSGITGSVTGTLKIVSPSSATVTLTGTYSNNVLTVSGGNYTFIGTLSNSSFSGTYSGPNGAGQFNAQPSSNNSVKVFAGTYTSNTISGKHGTFNIVIDGTNITGFTVSASSGDSTPLTGILSGNNITILSGVAVGTLSESSVSGTYNNGQGDAGIWSGTQIN